MRTIKFYLLMAVVYLVVVEVLHHVTGFDRSAIMLLSVGVFWWLNSDN